MHTLKKTAKHIIRILFWSRYQQVFFKRCDDLYYERCAAELPPEFPVLARPE